MSLVAIALDRYLAVLNKSQAKILQNKVFCFSALFLVWALSCGISGPMLVSYDLIETYVVPDENQEQFYRGYLCIAEVVSMTGTLHFHTTNVNIPQSEKANIIVFTLTFLPIFVAFVWLNAIIAKEIWKRRHIPGAQSKTKRKRTNEDSSILNVKSTDETNTSSNGRNNSSKMSSGESKNGHATLKQPIFIIPAPSSLVLQPNAEPRRNEHQRRHRQMRMFKVILVLMSVFIICRLPNWIFLLYKLSHKVSGRLNWLLVYCFAIMGLLNCMLNPLLYTFLGETIRVTSSFQSACCKFCKLCCRRREAPPHYANNQTLFASNLRRKSDGGIYLGSQ